ncbi:MAG TPA: type II toxin-antitoxin system HigB family toxin [Terriglobia bacterium]|nr:type II toxin-antitoxin system HigB family toxin [Terriglobia bacterium]
MRIIGRKVMEKFKRDHADARSSLDNWYRVVSSREWNNFAELRQVFPTADMVDSRLVFNIGGNKYRLIADVNFRVRTLLVREVLTHSQYDRGGWKRS